MMMTEKQLILTPELVQLDVAPTSRTEALGELVGRLKDLGYVDEDFLQQAIQREEEYPTGLAFEHITIAIPHANPGNVLVSACTIARCAKPVLFRNMGEPSEEIPVELICVLALNDPNSHLALMNRLMNLFGDGAKVNAIRAAQTPEALCDVFLQHVFAE